jgi:WD40 repeat protein
MRNLQLLGIAALAGATASLSAQQGPNIIWQQTNAHQINFLRTVIWSPDGQMIAAGGGDVSTSFGNRGELTYWSAASGQLLKRITGFEVRLDRLNDLVFHPSGNWIVTAEGQGPSSQWAVNARSARFPVLNQIEELSYPVQSSMMPRIDISPDGALLARAQWMNPEVWVVDFTTGSIVYQWVAHNSGVTAVAFSPDGQYLATGGMPDNTVRIWRLSDQTLVKEFAPLETPYPWARYGALAIAFSPDGQFLASVNEGYDQAFRVWRLSDDTEVFRSENIYQIVHGRVRFTSDSRFLVASERSSSPNTSWVGRIRFVRIADGAVLHDWPFTQGGANNGVTDFDLSPDNTRIAIAEFNRTLTVAENPVFGASRVDGARRR